MKRLRLFLTLCAAFCATSASLLHAQFVDTDSDRMDDSYETTHGLVVGTDDRHGDLDGDGYPNLAEYLKSTLASDSGSVPTPDRIVGPGQSYTTIGAAIISLTADDQIIMVKPGTYAEAVSSTTRRVFLISESVDPHATTIQPVSGHCVSATKDLYLRGFTLSCPNIANTAGVYLISSGFYGVVQCILRGHSWGIYSYPPSSSVRNVVDVVGTLIQNGTGGGIQCWGNGSTFRLIHTTICDHAGTTGPAINNNTSGSTSIYSLTNCVMWNTGTMTQFVLSGATLTATYSCIRSSSVYSGTGNINADPLLLQGYLAATSPCVDTATATTALPMPEDLRGDARVNGSGPDMGAHEYGTGGSWAGDFDGDGLGDTAEVYAHGSQLYSVDTDGDRIADGYEVTHGLALLVDDRHGDADGDGFPNLAEFLKNTLASDAGSVPSPDRIVGAGQSYTTIGSAIASLTADDQIILVKPGTYTEAVTSTVRRVFLLAEHADANATTIQPTSGHCVSATKDMHVCGFTLSCPNIANTAGVYLISSGSYGIVRCVLRGHSWGIYSYPPSSSVRNVVDVVGTLIHNGTGGGIQCWGNGSTFRLVHTTICGHSGTNAPAINNNTGGSNSIYTLTNCVIWNTSTMSQFFLSGASLTATNSCIRSSTVHTGTGNINADPLLVQGYLTAASPCVNAALAATVPSAVRDVRGDPRVNGSGPDMGAHEYGTAGAWGGDFDGDGLSDLSELSTYGSSFSSTDTDSDRMSDGYEAAEGLNLLADDRHSDADGDGFPNVLEALKNTQAGNASSIPSADRTVGIGQTYTTIGSAITSLTAEDQLIIVKPGTYAETISNTVRRVYLFAENADANATTIRPASGNCVNATKDLFLRGFTLVSPITTGINLTGSGQYGIVQCILRGHAWGISSVPSSSSVRNNVDVISSLIHDGRDGGIIASNNSSTFRLVHATIAGHAGTGAPGIFSQTGSGGGSIYTLTNSVVWNTGSNSQFFISGGMLTATFSCIRGTSVLPGTGNINTNPLLLQGYLSASSPCINTATAAIQPTTAKDLRGEPRVNGAGPDMGAHEYGTTGVWAGDFDGDGLSDLAELITHGTSLSLADTDSDTMNDGYEVAGGLNLLVDDRFGDADGDGFPNVLEALRNTQAGNASSAPTADRIVGTGQTYTTIGSAITSLTAEDQLIIVKPGTYVETVTSTARRAFLIAEHADANATVIQPTSGNGINATKDLFLRGFTVVSPNTTGINLTGSGYYGIVQCILRGHLWGISSTPSSSSVRNFVDVVGTLIQDGSGSGIYGNTNSSTFRLVHTTISGHMSNGAPGIFSQTGSGGGSIYTLTNCVIWNPGSVTQFFISGGSLTGTYSCVRGTSVLTGVGNTNTDPLLLQGYLTAASPCVNTATAFAPPYVSKDVRGDARVSGAGPDRGAHEYSTGGAWAGDFDGDGLSDLAELFTHGSSFSLVDTDSDRMSDGYEVAHGLNILALDGYADKDHDGFPNVLEALKATQASNASSMPSADAWVGVGQTYTTISAALTALTADDQLVMVKPGVYEEVVNNAQANNALNRRLFLMSESRNPADTFVRATPGTGGAVRSTKDLYLAGFTIDGVGQSGVSLTGGGSHALAHCVLRGHYHGVLISASPSSLITAVDLTTCLVTDGLLYGIHATTPSRLRLVHSTITGHGMGDPSTAAGRSLYLFNGNHTVTVSNSILWCGGLTQVYGATTTTYNNSVVRAATAPSGTGNVIGDPLLNQGKPGVGSSAINIGGTTPFPVGKDLALNARVFGTAADAGCYEFQRSVPSGAPSAFYLAEIDLSAGTGDFDGDGLTDAEEAARGTDPFIADTDGDGVNDSTDRYPLDPNAAGTPGGTDTTAPTISISQPSGAVKL